MQKIFSTLLCICLAVGLFAQSTYPQNGVYDHREGSYAFTNATIFTSYNQKIEGGTLVIKDGKVVNVGKGIAVPKGAVVFDLKGKYIYPSFIEMNSNYGMPTPKAEGKRPDSQPQMLSNKKGAYSWNESLKSEFRANEAFKTDEKTAEEWRKHGFGAVLAHRMDGISRGSSSLVTLADDSEKDVMIRPRVAHHLSFNKGTSTQNYPSSLMGAIALLRQTYLDAQWYKNGVEKEYNISLKAWNELLSLPQIFQVRDRLEAFRANKIGQEFQQKYIFVGNGDEYKRIDDIKALASPFIIPVDFPKAYDVQDPFAATQLDLSDMMHWELAPTNPARLAKAGIEFAFTTSKLKDKGELLTNIQSAIKHGLSEEAALKALTHTPAKLLNASSYIGSLEAGKYASFIITDKNVFEKGSKIHHNWVKGQGHVVAAWNDTDLTGTYDLKVGSTSYTLNVKGDATSPKMTIAQSDSTNVKVEHSLKNGLINLAFNPKGEQGQVINLSGYVEGTTWSGKGTVADGSWVSWSSTQTKKADSPEEKKDDKEEKDKEKKEEKKVPELADVLYPFVGYGNAKIPTQQKFLIKNATVWTNEKDGILENTDVCIKNGKIEKIGTGLKVKGAIEIDGTGKHLTAGIIDEHSHIAISRGVNEGTQSSSAEVRIGDVINSEDVNIYRQLAGGVTCSQLLHGSANPIGGQAALVKWRWGYVPEKMKFENAAGFIKFALGENVKQSNWGDDWRSRFPQTRMGVEQVFEDHFVRAKEYEAKHKADPNARRDLDMETILEIANSQRFVTCHSYVQSEINMLMKVAERHNFTLNTFTHILEGYKIADKMKAHGAGGSTFSDWWAYKYEVIDAIPHNAALLNDMGVVVAINSDDAEMGRRLNQEAAKSIMYADMSEEDAWKLVTLNPAKLLHVDDRTGSIKKGKDADVVLWSHNPLSIYAKAEVTWVDGIKFFDRKDDLAKRKVIQAERARLIQKMLDEKMGGAKTQVIKVEHKHHYHCDDVEVEIRD